MGMVEQRLLSGTNLENGLRPHDFTFDDKRDFLRHRDDEDVILGWYMPTPYADFALPDTLDLVTELRDVPKGDQTVYQQGKGVGPRLHNTPEATGGYVWQAPAAAAYILRLAEHDILDLRQQNDATIAGRVGRATTHLQRVLRAKLLPGGLEAVVQDVHASYGAKNAVQMHLPPKPEALLKARGIDHPAGIRPSFIIVRNPYFLARRVGVTPF